MRSTLYCVVLSVTVPLVCFAQKWEVGGAGGYGWYVNPTISNSLGSADAGFPPKGAIGAVFGNNMYDYIGGEIRYLFRFGGPELKFGGIQTNMSGHTNLVNYDLLIHLKSRDNKFRPFFAGGAGIKVFSGTGSFFVNQPLAGFAVLKPHTEVEPVISAGGGLKYRFTKHALGRIDFRTYFSPLPNDIFRTPGFSRIRGWVYDFVPMAGVSYVF